MILFNVLGARRSVSATRRIAATGSAAMACLALLGGMAHAQQKPVTDKPALPRTTLTVSPALLTYDLAAGSSRKYAVRAFFSGHIPPFALPGAEPVHLKVELVYVATVKHKDADGAKVEFNVETADLSLLEKEPGPDGKVDPATEAPFPLPLSQVQSALNATAVLRPDGSIASIEAGNAPPIKVNLGMDLRKLFLLIMPVSFPDKSVQVNDSWNYADGLLGNDADRVKYTAHVDSVAAVGKTLTYTVTEESSAVVDDQRDADDKPTTADVAVKSLTGKVTLTGDMQFATVAGAAGSRTGHLSRGKLVMVALIDTKQKPDPDHPEMPAVSKIDVKARLFIHELMPKVTTTARTPERNP